MTVEPIDDAIDHVRGGPHGRVILEYGDYECPYSRLAFREIERIGQPRGIEFRFAFRHSPLMEIHAHAASAAAAAEAAAVQGKFWEMSDRLFAKQSALEDDDLRRYARDLGLDLDRFEADRASDPILARVARDLVSGNASGQVSGTPTLFIDGDLYEGAFDGRTLIASLTS